MTAFTVPAGALAPAAHFAAKWLHPKPAVPIYGGLLFEFDGDRLTVSGFGENVTARAVAPVETADSGAYASFVVSGRLIDSVVGTLPGKPIRIEHIEGQSHVTMTCGSWRGTLPVMSDSDYPKLAEPAALAGHIDGPSLADAVHRVAAAANRDMTKDIPLLGMHLTFDDHEDDEQATITLMCTDRYRAARTSVAWTPDPETEPVGQSVLPLAAALNDAVEAFADSPQVTLGFEGSKISLTSPERSLVMTQTLPDLSGFPAAGLAQMFYRQTAASVRIDGRDLAQPLKTAAHFVNKDTQAVRLTLRPDTLILSASAEGKGDGDEEIGVGYDGPDTELMLKLPLLQSAMQTAPGGVVDLAFDPGTHKPAVLTAPADPAWRFIIMPLKQMGPTT